MGKAARVVTGLIGGAVGFLVGGPAGAAIGFGLGMTKVGEKIINKVLDFVTKPFLGAFGVPDMSQYNAQREEGVIITKRGGGTEYIPVVYGFRQVGGIITFATTGSTNNKYLWVAYVLSEGPVEGIHALFIDDNDVTNPALIGALNRGEQVDITSGKYNGRVRMQFWYGKQYGSNADSSPVGGNAFMKEAPGWKTTDAYNGLATLFVRYEWKQITTQDEANNNPFTGALPMIKVNLLGRRVLPIDGTAQSRDWATDVNAGRERYSTNPAEIILDYLRNPFYGKGLQNSEIDWVSFETARDKYNQDVDYINGVKGPILTTNCVIDTGVSLMGNVKTLLAGCRSYMPYVQGKYKLKVEDAGNENDITSGVATVVHTYTPDNIVGEISYGGVPRDSVFSEFEVTYVDPNNKWSTNTIVYPTTEDERIAYQVLDGGRINKGQATFSTITNYAMAYDMARLLFLKSRHQETLNLKVTSQAMELEPGDNIQVQGNTLQFQTGESAAPWRVISIKANDDYTFDLGCVLNPDFIYPHTRAGEKDIILPPFIPRYESIDYPLSEYDLSLRPPTNAYIGGEPITSPLDPPPPTDPGGGTGGGVGDQNGEQNQDPITVPPPPAPPVQEVFNHYIQVDKVTYTVNGNLVQAEIDFIQPDSPTFAGVDFWFKRNISTQTVYQTNMSTQTPGSGQLIKHIIPGLIKGATPYLVIARVRYQNGNSSTVVTKFGLNVGGAVSSENPADYEEVVGGGWQPPNTTPDPVQKDIGFDLLQAFPTYASPGVPTLDRGLSITVTQDINNSPYTTAIKGLKIYYKQASAAGYKSYTEYFDGSYFPGQSYTFTTTDKLDLGLRTYPNPDDASDDYNFILRWIFDDGSEGTRQVKIIGSQIENTSNTMVFHLGVVANAAGIKGIVEDSTVTTPTPEPPGSVIDTREIEINVTLTKNSFLSQSIVWTINPPDATNRSNWYGVRVRYRKIPIGGGDAGPFEVYDALPVEQKNEQGQSTPGIWSIVFPIKFDDPYQFVLTPMVRYSGAKTEAYRSVYQEGKIHSRQDAPDYPSNADWSSRLKTSTINTSDVSTIQTTPFPTPDPEVVIPPGGWRKIQKTTNVWTANSVYFELEYKANHIVGLTGVRIYRRSNNNGPYGTGLAGSSAKYHGYGRWEYIDVDPAPTATPVVGKNAVTLDNGNILINLRAPINWTEYNFNYLVPGTTGGGLLNTQIPWLTKKVTLPLNTNFYDYLVVASTSAGVSAVVTRLPALAANALGTTSELPKKLPYASFDGFDAGFQRNLTPDANNGSRANLTSNLNVGSSTIYTAPTVNRGAPVV